MANRVTRIAPDNNDLVVWKLDDAGNTFVNSSTSTLPGAPGSSANLSLVGGSVINRVPSIFGMEPAAVYFPGVQNRTTISGANSFQPTYPITLSFWIQLRTWNTTFTQHWVNKQHTTNVWSGTFMSIGIENVASSGLRNGEWNCNVISSGASASAQNTAARPIPLHVWCHMGMTYDGTTVRSYLNGNPGVTATMSSPPRAIAYNSGPWFMGAPVGAGSAEDMVCSMCDVRIANVVRPASYFSDVWLAANQNSFSQSGSDYGSTVTYYKLRAFDLSCNQAVYWIDTIPIISNAPPSPCGGEYGPVEVVESWDVIVSV